MSAHENTQLLGTNHQSRSTVVNVISRFALLVLIVVLLYLLISGSFFSASPFVIIPQLLAVGLSIWARRSFQAGQFSIHAMPKEGQLLEAGPYKYIRHPMYAAALLLVWASILGHVTLVNVVVGLAMTGFIAVRMATEEGFLRNRYPGYAEYARKTKRVIPFVV